MRETALQDSKTESGVYYRGATLLLLASVFVYSLLRAKSQSIAHDEALTFVSYVSGGAEHVLTFSPNNHLLFTLAAVPLIKLFGVSELVLRIPSLIGLVIYLVGSYLLCRRLFGSSILFPLISVLLVCNPLVLDFLVAARGYGLALGFLLVAMASFADLASQGLGVSNAATGRWKCAFASTCLGLSVAANLSYAIPAAGLALLFATMSLKDLPAPDRSLSKRAVLLCQWLFAPGMAVGLFILWPYLIHIRISGFVFGYARLPVLLRELVNSSLMYKWTDDTYANLGAVPLARNSCQYIVSTVGAFFALPLLTLLIFHGSLPFAGSVGLTHQSREMNARRRFFCGSTSACIILLGILHFAMHGKYPVVRGCLYLIPLFTVSLALVAREYACAAVRVAKVVGLVVACAIGCDYLWSLQMSSFRYNVYDARSREAFLSVVKDVRARGLKQARVAGTWWYEPEMNFYRARYKDTPIERYDVIYPSTPPLAQIVLPAGYDYVCFVQDTSPDLGGRSIRVVFDDAKTGIVIAAVEK